MSIQTAERVSHIDESDNYVYQRSKLAYVEAAKLVSGKVLELGTGQGYGVAFIKDHVDKLVTLDKYAPDPASIDADNVVFRQMEFPPLDGIHDNSFDFVISFQVIEHIEDDELFVKEAMRVLKPGGKFILTTPNIKMSITRNPWHVREYTAAELTEMLGKYASSVESNGVFGNEVVQTYYEANKKSVQRLTRFDIFNLQYRLPRSWLQVPYDILNRRNRKKLLKEDNAMVKNIKMEDYAVAPVGDKAFDLFYVATK